MVRRALLVCSLFVVGCFPPPLDELGKKCSPDHECGEHFTCFDLICQVTGAIDAGPDNLLVNSDFEAPDDGGASFGWRSNYGEVARTTTAHQGSGAGRLFTLDGGPAPSMLPEVLPVKGTLLGQVYCGRGWVRGENGGDAGLPFKLNIVERFTDGGSNPSAKGAALRTSADGGWDRVLQTYVALGDGRLGLQVDSAAKLKSGEALLVDDLQLKRSVDVNCTW